MNNSLIRLGALLAMLAVIFGAFGAHVIKDMVDEYSLEIWNKAVFYQFIHAITIILCGILCFGYPKLSINKAAIFFTAGIVLFSGSLYILTFKSVLSIYTQLIGPLTPLGGISFIIGWSLLIVAAGKK